MRAPGGEAAGGSPARHTAWAFAALGTAAVFSSVMAPALAWFGAERAPFLFNGVWKLGFGLACLLLLAAGGRAGLAYGWRAGWLGRCWRRSVFWGGVLLAFGFALAGAAGRFVDYLLVTVLLELYPLALVFFMPWALGQGRTAAAARRRSRRRVWPWVVVALLGAGLAAFSPAGGFDGGAGADRGLGALLLGAGLAFAGAAAYGCVVFIFRLGGSGGISTAGLCGPG